MAATQSRPRPDPRAPSPEAPLELWGGVECTHNRVGDTYLCQLARSGHDRRLADLDAIAALGLKTLRYPLLWERTAPRGLDTADWRWTDERFNRLRELGISPIAGLVHHGSGPVDTHLLDPAFPRRLAAYAGAVARRYPWISAYTPINEPLTTARFSGLYGHWYPHQRRDAAFVRALLHQCQATAAAMRAIRVVNPEARLVVTEDLGMTLSTPRLAYQANFENERRWLSFDLLCGRVDRNHPLHGYLLRHGARPDELAALADEPPPDLLGVNHYVTSVRFLDQRVRRYPAAAIGGNGYQRYADVEAVRVCADFIEPEALFTEVWRRYGRPFAITEAHLGCTTDEQQRWLKEIWDAAQRARLAGADLRAVTAWSLLGAYDWHCLVTRDEGRYEPGAFDLREGPPRPTELARMIDALARGATPDLPALAEPGWWRRPERLVYPPVRVAPRPRVRRVDRPRLAEPA
ncbi:MAG TPA: family 1 glycosylhydrolase [Nannocystis sp.]